jgi:hypothetical protein
MDEVAVNTAKTVTLSLPVDPDSQIVFATVVHEFGDTVYPSTRATRTGVGAYKVDLGQLNSGFFILNSAGKHRVDFTYSVSGTSYTQSKYLNVVTPYGNHSDFFDSFPDLEDNFGNQFDYFAKKAKLIIETFCGQVFDYYPAKTLKIQGGNYKTLRLPIPITELLTVVQDYGDQNQVTLLDANNDFVEKIRNPFNFDTTYNLRFKTSNLDSPSYIQYYNRFDNKSTFSIYGDWGWRYVPENITQALYLLIADYMNGDSEYRNHGINRMDMDSLSMRIHDKFYESTGNIEADVLLMYYTLFIMEYVV